MAEDSSADDFISNEEFDKKYANRVMILLTLLVVVVMYIEGMLTPSLLQIATDFKVTEAQVSLVLSTYLIGGVALAPIVGKLGDIYGKKKVLSIVLIAYAAAVSVTGFSPNLTFMVVSRGVQGIGMSIMPLGMSLMREEFPKDMIPKAQALLSAMFGVGFAVSMPLGSWVSNDFGWRWTYHSAIPFVLVLALVTIFMIKESKFRRPDTKIDYIGAALLAGSLSLFVFALSEGSNWGWLSQQTLLLVAVGALLLIPLALYETSVTRKGLEAILNTRLLSERNVMVANIALTIAGLGMFLAFQALTFKFGNPSPSGFGKSTLMIGLSLVPFALGMTVFAPVAGILVTRTGVKPLAILGAIVTALGFVLMTAATTYVPLLAMEFLTGSGMSLMNASLINLIVLTVKPKDMGLATAMNTTFRSVGSSVGAPVAGSLLASFTLPAVAAGGVPGLPSDLAYSSIFTIAAVVFLLAALAIVFGHEVLGRRAKQATEVSIEAKSKGGSEMIEAATGEYAREA